VQVTAWLLAYNTTAPPCQVLAELLVDGSTVAGPAALSTVPSGLGVAVQGGNGELTIPLAAALNLTPNATHTVQIRAQGSQQGNIGAACGAVGRTRIVLVDLG